MKPAEFYEKYAPWAVNEFIRSGVPASITLAQAALESGYGESQLTREACNFFGIKKGVGWKGETYTIATPKDNTAYSEFRKYDSPRESFKDHSNFLLLNQRYKSLFKDSDYKNWANGLQAAGYSETPTYGSTVIQIIEKYGLQKYDEEARKKKL